MSLQQLPQSGWRNVRQLPNVVERQIKALPLNVLVSVVGLRVLSYRAN